MTKYLILTNNLLNSYKKSSQITTEKDFDIVPKFIAILKDGHSIIRSIIKNMIKLSMEYFYSRKRKVGFW
jgi:hypothetical protein